MSGSSIIKLTREAAKWAAFGLVALITAEIGARVDDWFFDDVPVLENPSYESLFYRDDNHLRHGRPGVRWKKVRMNNLGMRGDDVAAVPKPGCRRLMFLGASETFGEPSMTAAEYPMKVRSAAGNESCIEILNTAFPGVFPQTLQDYYTHVLARHAPDTVFVYPSTHFYLSETLPREPKTLQPAPAVFPSPPPIEDERDVLDKSRFIERLRDSVETPAFIQRRIDRKHIDAALAAAPQFDSVPAERLELLAQDLRGLVSAIRASGAEPVLMTHAVRVNDPPRPEDLRDLSAMRVYTPRAPEPVLAAFEYASAEVTRRVARETGTRLIDIARDMSGRRELFIDLVHFTPAGHEHVAHLIVDEMRLQSDRYAVQ